MWNVINLTDANSGAMLEFDAHGSVFVEGSFGGGTVDFYPMGFNNEEGQAVTSSTALVSLDAANADAELPNGKYAVSLNGSTAGDVNLFHLSNVVV